MNELQIRGWIYYETEKNTALEAYTELCNTLKKAGINTEYIGLDIVLRNEYGKEIDIIEDKY